ncbi:hypothetical protein [Tepidibacter thalassicus]|uniref:Uncharacterized protein n=1 Tax=Tepidibacter thalassicus DSM 15285 TaxID=1123350 RepID=A0A1M5PVF6_9FIRM|nr:hypothetical protein [Tepidibacter thalassicus]SHH05672.1 hypothetical protein SAMN02744040_00620 [Tepidibacter thalassicus DSM 15285]
MKIKKYIEIFITYIISIIITYIFYKCNVKSIYIFKIDTLFSMIVTVVVTLVGFLITSITILIGIIEKKIIKKINEEKMWNMLIYYFIEPIVSGLLILLHSFYIIFKTGSDNIIFNYRILIFIFLSVLFIVGIVRIGYMLVFILKILPLENSDIVYDEKSVTISQPEDAFRNQK